MKFNHLVILSPFITVIVIILMVCLTIVSPFILIHFMWVNRKRQTRRQSVKHPLMTILNSVPKSAQ
jgi:hypothetical protein